VNLGLEGRKVVVAGGTRGIGRASAEAFAAEGARVAVLARSVIDLRETEAALLEAGALEAIGLECDLFDTGEVEAAFSFVEDQWSELHVLVNAAGPSHLGTFDELTDGEWLDAFDAGVLMTVRAVRAALPLIRQASFGRIINLTASSIRHQSAGLAAYTAAKAALASAALAAV
jgi:3-oxoacyl-[acyl-carrier protein] reductase